MKPFITLKSGTRLRFYDIRMYTESHRWEFGVQKEPTGSFVELFSRENRLHVSDSPAEIDALIEAALADQQPADREPQAALPRTDEPQDPIARLEAWRKRGEGRNWSIDSADDVDDVAACVLWFSGAYFMEKADEPHKAVSLALAAAKEAGHG